MEPKGTVRLAGEIVGDGGSIAAGGEGNGALAANITIEDTAETGAFIVAPTGVVTLDGGGSGGVGTAGGGGHFTVRTLDGDMSMGGTLNARGGAARDPGGSGGLGGMVYLFSDNNHNAVDVGKGNLLITPSGKLDASGGDGGIGGSARNDGSDWVANFPDDQEQIAIFLNCDGQHGETRNWMENDGILIARGGVHNGNGGDIVYHGIGPGQRSMPTDGSGNHHPPPGNQDMAADGTGMPGAYGGE